MEARGKLTGIVNIREHPAEAEVRAAPGHRAGDLLPGATRCSLIGTRVERKTRLVMLLGLPEGRYTEQVVTALSEDSAEERERGVASPAPNPCPPNVPTKPAMRLRRRRRSTCEQQMAWLT